MTKVWRIIPQATKNGPVTSKWVSRFPREDPDTGEVSFILMKHPVLRTLIDNDSVGRTPLAVQWSQPRGWHIKYPPRTEQRLVYRRGRRDYWDAPTVTTTPVQEFSDVGSLRDALVKRCGAQIAQDVLGEMMPLVD